MADARHTPAETTRRLFLGLWPPQDVRHAIVDARRRWFWPQGTRLTPASKLHLTLHFLGDVHANDEAALREVLAGVEVAPFDIALREPQAWRSGLVVWRTDDHEALLDLRERVAICMGRSGFAAQRPWTPHVTLARDATGAAPPEAFADIAWPVHDFVLVWSRPGPAGYAVLETFR